MQFIFCTGGEEAELQATRNFGECIIHVIGNPTVKVDLADPGKAHHPGGGFAETLVALGAQMNPTPLATFAAQQVATLSAQEQILAQAQANNWLQITERDYAAVLSGNVFDDLDKLAGVL